MAGTEAPSDLPGLANYAAREQSLADRFLTQISVLTPPKELQSTFERFVNLQGQQNRVFVDVNRAARASDQAALQRAYAEGQRLAKMVGAAARQLGAPVCAEDIKPVGQAAHTNAASASSASGYSADVEQQFVTGCSTGPHLVPQTRCTCAMRWIEANVPFQTYLAADQAIKHGSSAAPEWLRRAMAACA